MSSLLSVVHSLPRDDDEVWEFDMLSISELMRVPGASGRMPRVEDETRIPLWVRRSEGKAINNLSEDAADAAPTPIVQLITLLNSQHRRPGRIEVRRTELVEEMAGAAAKLGIRVVLAASLPGVDRVAGEFGRALLREVRYSQPMDAPGVTLDLCARFAAAAAEFARAQPWRELSPLDALVVESPPAPAGMGCFVIQSEWGEPCGIQFFESAEDLWQRSACPGRGGDDVRADSRWMLMLVPPDQLPPGALLSWDASWPVADAESYPLLFRAVEGQVAEYADADRLNFIEGLLLALARTSPQQLDAGRWAVAVQTAAGPRSFELAIPDLLKPPTPAEWRARGVFVDLHRTEWEHVEAQNLGEQTPASKRELDAVLDRESERVEPNPSDSSPRSNEEAALRLVQQALCENGRGRLLRVRQALTIDPDSVEALLLCAEFASSPQDAEPLVRRAVESGRRRLGSDRFEAALQGRLHFWNDAKTRPFMRALASHAACLRHLGHNDESLAVFRELLQLDPSDPLQMRHRYLPMLLASGRFAEARDFARSDVDDNDPVMLFGRAFAEFLVGGDTFAARQALTVADRSQPGVIGRLLAEGDEQHSSDDAWEVSDDLLEYGALVESFESLRSWLEVQLESMRSRRTSSRGGRPGFKRRNRRSR